MKKIERRLATLEQGARAEAQVYIWPNIGETVDEAVARQFPEDIPEAATVIVIQFGETPHDGGWGPE